MTCQNDRESVPVGSYFCAAKKRLLEKFVLKIKQETSAALLVVVSKDELLDGC